MINNANTIPKSPNFIKYAGLIFILGIATASRLYHLGFQSLWLDEGFSYRFSRLDWHELLFNLSTYETHPPFYYSLLKIWSEAFGYSEFAMRSLSTLASLASIPLIYMSAKLLSNKDNGWKMGLLAALMLALSPLQLAHAQNARPYAFYTLAMALSTFCLCWLWSRRDELAKPFKDLKISQPRAIIIYIGLGLGVALLQWLHNTAITFIFPIALSILWLWAIVCKANRSIFSGFIISGLCAILFYAPYIPQFWGQIHSFSNGGFWLSQPSFPFLISSSLLLFGNAPHWLPIYLWFEIFLITGLPLIGLAIWSWISLYKNIPLTKNPLWMLLILSIIPWITNLFITFTLRSIYMERLLIPLQFPWYILLSAAPFAVTGWKRKIILVMMITLSFMGAAGYHLYPKRVPHNTAKWREIVQKIKNEDGEKPAIITVPEFSEVPLSYYTKRFNLEPKIIGVPITDMGALTALEANSLIRPFKGQKIIWVTSYYTNNKIPENLERILAKDYNLNVISPSAPEEESALFKYTLKPKP